MSNETVTPTLLSAWYVTEGFINSVRICQCGTVHLAMRVIYETLALYPSFASADSHSPGTDPQAVFAATVLDSWGLIDHAGSIDAGAFRTDRGEILYQAMRSLDEAGEHLLPHMWDGNVPDGWDPPLYVGDYDWASFWRPGQAGDPA